MSGGGSRSDDLLCRNPRLPCCFSLHSTYHGDTSHVEIPGVWHRARGSTPNVCTVYGIVMMPCCEYHGNRRIGRVLHAAGG